VIFEPGAGVSEDKISVQVSSLAMNNILGKGRQIRSLDSGYYC